jgi:hypothetical protein
MKNISVYEKEKELIKLIEDTEKLEFNPKLIQKYKTQLSEVQQEIKLRKERKKKFNMYKNDILPYPKG